MVHRILDHWPRMDAGNLDPFWMAACNRGPRRTVVLYMPCGMDNAGAYAGSGPSQLRMLWRVLSATSSLVLAAGRLSIGWHMLCVANICEKSGRRPLTHISNERRRESAALEVPKFEGSDRPRGCYPGPSATSEREEGGHGRRYATWFVRPAEARASFSSVMVAGSPQAVPQGTCSN